MTRVDGGKSGAEPQNLVRSRSQAHVNMTRHQSDIPFPVALRYHHKDKVSWSHHFSLECSSLGRCWMPVKISFAAFFFAISPLSICSFCMTPTWPKTVQTSETRNTISYIVSATERDDPWASPGGDQGIIQQDTSLIELSTDPFESIEQKTCFMSCWSRIYQSQSTHR